MMHTGFLTYFFSCGRCREFVKNTEIPCISENPAIILSLMPLKYMSYGWPFDIQIPIAVTRLHRNPLILSTLAGLLYEI